MARLTFDSTMDSYSHTVRRENPARDGVVDGSTARIGSIQWHPGHPPRFLTQGLESFTLSELEAIVARLRQESRNGGQS